MRMRFSGVLAASIIAAGVFWSCSESSDGVSVPEGELSSNSFAGDTGNYPHAMPLRKPSSKYVWKRPPRMPE